MDKRRIAVLILGLTVLIGQTASARRSLRPTQAGQNLEFQTMLRLEDTRTGDFLGHSIVFDDKTLLGATIERTHVGVFTQTDGAWEASGSLPLPPAMSVTSVEIFGASMDLKGDLLLVGAPGENSAATGVNGNEFDTSANNSGAAFLYQRAGGNWTKIAYLKASNTDSNDQFGANVAIAPGGELLAIAAPGEASAATGVDGDQDSDAANHSGAVYVFVRDGATWRQEAYLKASNSEAADQFGASLAISDTTIVVGSYREDSAATGVNGNQDDNSADGSGAAYVFVRDGATWRQEAYLKAANAEAGDQFGWSVAMDNDQIIVGANFEDSAATGINGDGASNGAAISGAAYVFQRRTDGWEQTAYLKASNTNQHDQFGTSVALANGLAVVGAIGESSAATGVNGDQADNSAQASGAAYVFAGAGAAWQQTAYVKASNTDPGDSFGFSVLIGQRQLAIGAINEDFGGLGQRFEESGAVYLFNLPARNTIYLPRLQK